MKFDLKKICLGLLALGVGSLWLGGTLLGGGIGYRFDGRESRPFTDRRTVQAAGVTSVEVTTVSTDVRWHEVPEGPFRVELHGSSMAGRPELAVVREQDGVRIKVWHRPQFPLFWFGHGGTTLDVYVPQRHWKELSFRTTSGDVSLGSVEVDQFRQATVSGELTAEALATRSADLSSTSGDADLHGFQGDLAYQSVSGNLEVEFSRFANEVQLKTTSGELNLDLPEGSGFALDATSVSGDISCAFPITVLSGGNERHSLKGTVGDGAHRISSRSVSGNLRLH